MKSWENDEFSLLKSSSAIFAVNFNPKQHTTTSDNMVAIIKMAGSIAFNLLLSVPSKKQSCESAGKSYKLKKQKVASAGPKLI